ncbi:MAG: hypothetical protein HBSAPP04_05480 [Ignavibacteriaceae bacterium]|nr:MAG: hypothetical protein EDM75_05065 [Chlorobiota bacterium]GJQ31709.1 MAG: hypothetical protein HBSAPP04_05480 [Ignavibacteriaceae bacterium]
MFIRLTVILAAITLVPSLSFSQLRPDSFQKYDSTENYIRDSLALRQKLVPVIDIGTGKLPLKIFIIGDSFIASGEFAGYFAKEIAGALGRGGDALLTIHKKFPSRLTAQKHAVKSQGHSVSGFQLLTGASAEAITVFPIDGTDARIRIDSSGPGGIFVSFSKPLSGFYIATSENVPEIAVAGIILRYAGRGVVTSYFGSESASIRTYNNQMGHIFKLLASYLPDVLVINLGVNDCAGPNFNKNYADAELKYFLKNIRNAIPQAALLFISPPGFHMKRKEGFVTSPGVNIFRDRLDLLAAKEGFAWWDMKAVMGGENSMAEWVKAGLAISDHIHLSTHGMSLIAKLLSGAIIDLYRKDD